MKTNNLKLYPYALVEILLVCCSTWFLRHTNSIAYIYEYVAVFAICAIGINLKNGYRRITDKKTLVVVWLLTVIFAISVCLANYSLLLSSSHILLKFAIIFIACIVVAYNILVGLIHITDNYSFKTSSNTKNTCLVFLAIFALLSLVYSVYFYIQAYPGYMTTDTIWQIRQAISHEYSNHHPFWHTILIEWCMGIGSILGFDINGQVAVYSQFQILIMSAIFSYFMTTMYQMKLNIKYICFAFVWFVVAPHHLLYSCTIWKDVLFGGFVLMFSTALYRDICNVGKSKALNYIWLGLSALGVCLFRSNGLLAFMVLFIVFLFVYKKTYKKELSIFAFVIALTFVLQGPVLNLIGVKKANGVEALSIPLQQVTRVLVNGGDVDASQMAMIEKVVSPQLVKEDYKSYISDPVKVDVVFHGDQEYLLSHKGQYLKLWFDIGVKNPGCYVMAWVDQTKGYFNGAYDYWQTARGVKKNDLGIYKRIGNNDFERDLESKYLESRICGVFWGIGFNIWVMMSLFAVCISRKNGAWVLGVLPVSIILTLLVATPVYSEWRYAYSIFCLLPLIFVATFYSKEQKVS